MNKKQAIRLSKVAEALEDVADSRIMKDLFTMEKFGWELPESYYEPKDVFEFGFLQAVHDITDPDGPRPDRVGKAMKKLVKEETLPHNCGAPACALGHFAVRTDLQRKFTLTQYGSLRLMRDKDHPIYPNSKVVKDYFGVNYDEASDLFGEDGCDGATTPKQAAKYIRKFLKQRGYEALPTK